MKKSKNILISPLNWGLGHASRLIPIIDWCLENEKSVILAGNAESLSLLQSKYPNLKSEIIPAPLMKYGKIKAINLTFILRSALMILNIPRERIVTKQLIKKYGIDTIISDNRPGVWNKNIKTIYITHQINVYTGKTGNIIDKLLSLLHRRIIEKYTYCWIPDSEHKLCIAGRMSENKHNLNLNYLGILSRFSKFSDLANGNKEYKIVCIVSGPEPQRSILESTFDDLLSKSKHKSLLIRGIPYDKERTIVSGLIKKINHCDDNSFHNYISSAEIIICRSGYTTIMDLIACGKRAILIPTPGQPEQEYLAEFLVQNVGFISIDQSKLLEFNIDNFSGFELNDKTFDASTYKKVLALHL